jgi:hypothetical protein
VVSRILMRMEDIRSVRTGTWLGILALALTVGVMARRATVRFSAANEDLRDAVASPAPLPAMPAAPRPGAYAFNERPAPRPLIARRLDRLADALDAKAASLRASAAN